jgi:NTE family protein
LKEIPAADDNIENLKISYAAVAFNIADGKPYMIRGGNLGYAMQASSAVPTLRKPVQIGDKLFCDGGISCNLPVKQVREMGADFVIAVDIDEHFDDVSLNTFRKIGSVAKRVVNWGLYSIDKPQGALADIVIQPDTGVVGLISTRKKDARDCVEAGEKAAQAALPMIRQKLQQIGVACK